jgi:ABC-type bacteriocin/lantibiotic exporter with double-glycine peptidase domain
LRSPPRHRLLNIVLCVLSRREREGQQALLQDTGKMQGEIVSGLASIEFVKATGSEDAVFNRFTGFHATLLNKRQSLTTITQVLGAIPGLLSIIASALAIGIGAFASCGAR